MLKIESYKSGLIVSAIYNFIAKVLLFVQTVFVAYYFPVSETDIFLFCFSTITIFAWFINSLDYSISVPESMKIRARYSQARANKYLNLFLLINLLIGVSTALLFCLFPLDLMTFFSGFPLEQLERNKWVLYLFAPLLGLMIFATSLNNILVSYKYFTMPSVTSALTSTFAIVFMLFFHEEWGIISIILGLNLSYVLNILWLIIFMKLRLNWKFSFSIKMSRLISWKNIVVVQLGNSMSFLSTYFPYYLLSGYSPGVITALNYGQKTADMPTQLIINQVSSVSGIKLNELHAELKFSEVIRIFVSSTALLLFITIPICFISFFYANEIMTILYARGMFKNVALAESVLYFKVLIWLLPFVSVNTICARLFMSANRVRESSYYQLTLNLFLVLITYFFVIQFGPIGYPIALLSIYILNIFTIRILLNRYFKHIKFSKIYFVFLKIILLNIPIFIILNLLSDILPFDEFRRMIFCSLFYLMSIILLNYLIGINLDVSQALDSFINRFVNRK